MGRRVVEAQALEPIGILGRQPAIVGARGQDHGSALHALAVGELDLAQARPVRGSDDLRGLVDAGDDGAELARLQRRAPGEVGAGETGGEAEVVLDASARARLAARGEALDHQGAETLGGGVDGSGQPGRTAAEHDDVEALSVDLRSQPQLIGDRGDGRPPDDAVGADQDRAFVLPDAEARRAGPGFPRRWRGRAR